MHGGDALSGLERRAIMRQGSFGWLVGSVLIVLPAAAALGQGGPDEFGQPGIRGSAGTCEVLFGPRHARGSSDRRLEQPVLMALEGTLTDPAS